jgi:hypothetical protein
MHTPQLVHGRSFVVVVLILCDKQLWQTKFHHFRLIDSRLFEKLQGALELPGFQIVCLKGLEEARNRLLGSWFPETQRIFFNASKKKGIVPKIREQVSVLLSLTFCGFYKQFMFCFSGCTAHPVVAERLSAVTI